MTSQHQPERPDAESTAAEEFKPPPVPSTPTALLAASTVAFPPLGVAAILHARRAAAPSSSREERLHHAARARLLAWYSFGALFSIAVIALLVAIFVLNDYRFARDYFSLEHLAESLPRIIGAFWKNLAVSVVAYFTSLAWGLTLAIARGLPGPAAAPVRWLAVAYIDIFRGLPILLTILIIGFGLPLTGLPFVRDMDVFTAGVAAMTALYGAYLAEVFRSGIEGVHQSQTMAARSIGLNYVQTMRHVVLPQAVITIAPPLLGWYISILKDTSLLSILGLLEAVNVARISVINQNNLSALTGVALCFLVITIPLSRLTDYFLARSARKRVRGGLE
jgi:polar amino acid transport system permease protein